MASRVREMRSYTEMMSSFTVAAILVSSCCCAAAGRARRNAIAMAAKIAGPIVQRLIEFPLLPARPLAGSL